MSDLSREGPFPRGALIGALALVGFTLAAIGVARVSGVGLSGMPEATAVERLALTFEDRGDGAVVIADANDGDLVTVVEPGTNGFLRGVMRGMARERMRQGVGPQPPFHLIRWDDGRIALEDPETARLIDLGAFGPTNMAAFAGIMAAASHQN